MEKNIKKAKRYCYYVLVGILVSSCQISETLSIHEDGSGEIELNELRVEHSYMQLVGEEYAKEDTFEDTIYNFKDYISKYKENFSKYNLEEQQVFSSYKEVVVHVKKSYYDKEFKTTIKQSFNKIENVPDLFKTEDYADDLENNYALTAEKHYFKIQYTFDGSHFNRKVTITNKEELKKQFDQIELFKSKYSKFNLVQSYLLQYNFPRKIKSVSNSLAEISADKKSVTLEFLLSDCLQNPEITSLAVVLE